jgi:hypothetical protein
MLHEGVDALGVVVIPQVGSDAGKTMGLQDSPRIDGAEHLMFLNVTNFILKIKFFISILYICPHP